MKPHKANGRVAKEGRRQRAIKRAEQNGNNVKMLTAISKKETKNAIA